MRAPKQRGAPIDVARISSWESRFRYYRASPGGAEINRWLARFNGNDQDLAARVLDCVEVISELKIHEGYKETLDSIDGWHKRAADREGRWVFTGFGKPGESGMSMLRAFREANSLTAHAYDSLFCNMLEIPSLKLTAEDTIVLVDDFSGSGDQICRRWPTLKELIASEARCFIILTAATVSAIRRIEDETELKVVVQITIQRNENIFSDSCLRFNAADKAALLRYCRRADAKHPRGYNDCGLLYVLSHKTPNNSIPVLHTNHNGWVCLFPRNLRQE